MKYTKEQIAKVAHECAKQEAFHDNEYLGKIGCMLDDLLGRIAELEKDAKRWNMLPAVAADHQINLMALYRAIDAAMQKD